MANCHSSGTVTTSYFDVDIGRVQSNGSYLDNCNNKINIERQNILGSSYKKYTHSFTYPAQISNIKHRGQHQEFSDLPIRYGRKVSVYYLDYDEKNILPLILWVDLINSYRYYFRDLFLPSSKWETDPQIHSEDNLIQKLAGRTDLRNVIVMKLDENDGQYFANGDSTQAPKTNQNTKVTVSPFSYETVYRKYEHRLKGGTSLRLLSTLHNGAKIPFEEFKIYTKIFSSTSIYYWKEDTSHSHPLILELAHKSGSSVYYKLITDNGTKKWQHDGITTTDIPKVLDKLNCEKNEAHQIDISRNTGKEYQCPGCDIQKIEVAFLPQIGYSYCLHNIDSSSISKILNGTTLQTGFPSLKDVNALHTYIYPKDTGVVLLIHFSLGSKNCWYQRESSNKWKPVSEQNKIPTQSLGDTKILSLLQFLYIPRVIINVGNTDTNKSYECTLATHGMKEKIKVAKDVVTVSGATTNYSKFTHIVEGKTSFELGGVNRGEHKLNGIKSDEPLSSVSAFYSGNSPTSPGKLLLVELISKTTPITYKYYYKPTTGEAWIHLSRSSDSTQLINGPLNDQLNKLKETRHTGTHSEKKAYTDTHKRHTPNNSSTGHVVGDEPLASKTEGSSSGNPGLIAAGVIVGILLVGFATYEVYMIRRNPSRSLIMLANSKIRGQYFPYTRK